MRRSWPPAWPPAGADRWPSFRFPTCRRSTRWRSTAAATGWMLCFWWGIRFRFACRRSMPRLCGGRRTGRAFRCTTARSLPCRPPVRLSGITPLTSGGARSMRRRLRTAALPPDRLCRLLSRHLKPPASPATTACIWPWPASLPVSPPCRGQRCRRLSACWSSAAAGQALPQHRLPPVAACPSC